MYTGYIVEESELDKFARCLSSKGVKFYGSKYCGYCKKQKEIFRNAIIYIDYIECTKSENKEVCSKLRGVPAWDINGEIYYGLQSLDKLSQLSNCSLD